MIYIFYIFFFFEKSDQRPGQFIQKELKLDEHHEKLEGQYLANYAAKPEPQRLT